MQDIGTEQEWRHSTPHLRRHGQKEAHKNPGRGRGHDRGQKQSRRIGSKYCTKEIVASHVITSTIVLSSNNNCKWLFCALTFDQGSELQQRSLKVLEKRSLKSLL